MAFADQKTLDAFLNPKPEKEKKDVDGLGEWKRLADTLKKIGK